MSLWLATDECAGRLTVVPLGMDSDPIAPAWVVFPIAAIVLLTVAGHMIVLRELPKGKIPESRRRLRIATGWVMMFTIPLTAYGFGVASLADPGLFVLVWTMIVGLLCGVFVLAGVDVVNSMRLHREECNKLQHDFRNDSPNEGADEGADDV